MSDGPVVQNDLQDPLPESNWLWRRVFVFAVTAAVLWMLWGAIDRLGTVAAVFPEKGVPALLSLCKNIIALTMMTSTYYLVAPSAEQIVKMMKTATLLRNGVQLTGSTTTTTHEKTETTAAAAGKPPLPSAEAPRPPAPDVDPPWGDPPARG